MALSLNELARLRRMVADTGDDPAFTDSELIDIAEAYPLPVGHDLNAAAREVWELKAASLVEAEERFRADGKEFDYGNLAEKALKMARFYGERADALYSRFGFGQTLRDDVDPLGQGGSVWRAPI